MLAQASSNASTAVLQTSRFKIPLKHSLLLINVQALVSGAFEEIPKCLLVKGIDGEEKHNNANGG